MTKLKDIASSLVTASDLIKHSDMMYGTLIKSKPNAFPSGCLIELRNWYIILEASIAIFFPLKSSKSICLLEISSPSLTPIEE